MKNDLKNGKVFLGTFISTLLINKVNRFISAPNKIEVDYFGQKMCDLSLFRVVIIEKRFCISLSAITVAVKIVHRFFICETDYSHNVFREKKFSL